MNGSVAFFAPGRCCRAAGSILFLTGALTLGPLLAAMCERKTLRTAHVEGIFISAGVHREMKVFYTPMWNALESLLGQQSQGMRCPVFW